MLNHGSRDTSAAQPFLLLEQAGPSGKEWLRELAVSRDPWFNINVGDGFYHYHRAWNDDLSMPFAGLPEYMRRVRAASRSIAKCRELQAERKQLIEDYRDLLSTDEERAAYDQMITLAHRVFPYVEGHKFYCEHWYTNLFFNKIREFGVLLAKNGFFPDAEDVFHLTHYELKNAIIDMMTAWSNGSEPRGPQYWPKLVAERKAAIADLGEARHAARARAGAGCHRRSRHRDALGHHAREPQSVARPRAATHEQRRSEVLRRPAVSSKARRASCVPSRRSRACRRAMCSCAR